MRRAIKSLVDCVLEAVVEDVIKPGAKGAWQKTRPKAETAWERAKPEIQDAKGRTVKKVAKLASQVKPRRQGIAGELQVATEESSDKR